jgi:hypothetical protein
MAVIAVHATADPVQTVSAKHPKEPKTMKPSMPISKKPAYSVIKAPKAAISTGAAAYKMLKLIEQPSLFYPRP